MCIESQKQKNKKKPKPMIWLCIIQKVLLFPIKTHIDWNSLVVQKVKDVMLSLQWLGCCCSVSLILGPEIPHAMVMAEKTNPPQNNYT